MDSNRRDTLTVDSVNMVRFLLVHMTNDIAKGVEDINSGTDVF